MARFGYLTGGVIIILLGIVIGGYMASRVPEPAYTMVSQQQSIRIIRYEPRVIASITTTGTRKAAIRAGFSQLADFIFGSNQSSTRMEMTAPVMQTAYGDAWRIAFVMPSHYSEKTLPKPNNPQIQVETIPAGTYAVITFSGIASDAVLAQQKAQLQAALSTLGVVSTGPIWYAFYNPPWTLPFWRRHEVMVAVQWPVITE